MKVQAVRMLTIAACVLASAAPARAQQWAVRGGANINPDQVVVGTQYQMPVAGQLLFQPSADAGFGNGTTLFAVNLDVVQRWVLGRVPVWTVYAGGGPALNHYRLPGYSESELGVNVLGAAHHSSGLFVEFRVGFLDSPDYRFGAGYAFAHRPPKTRRPSARRGGGK